MGRLEIWDSEIPQKDAKSVVENARKQTDSLGIEFKHLRGDLKNYQASQKYLDCKSKLGEIYFKKASGVRIKSKCDWCESGEKFNKFFLNLAKTCASQGIIPTLIKNEREINYPAEISTELQDFYKTLFTGNLSISKQNNFSFKRFASTKTPGRTSYKMYRWNNRIWTLKVFKINQKW